MNSSKILQQKILQMSLEDFDKIALEVFHYQAIHNNLYQKYIHYLKINPHTIKKTEEIPFLPIEFFKQHKVMTGDFTEEKIFESSGTTGQQHSKHYVKDLSFYHQLSQQIFEEFYGALTNYHIFALLPSYLERDNSSLVSMVNYFIKQSQSPYGGFYLDNRKELVNTLKKVKKQQDRKIVLLGVTFGLLDLAEEFSLDLSEVIVMETGGMKGRRKEMVRAEVHKILKDKFYLNQVHSEYGMTELLSQAYSQGEEIFEVPSSMRIFLRDIRDPLTVDNQLKSGGLNIIDLANIHSCAFIATQDIGSLLEKQKFKVLGRFDHSDVRGCNLMVL